MPGATRQQVIDKCRQMIAATRAERKAEKDFLGKEYDPNSYGAGHWAGYEEAAETIMALILEGDA